jgi:predicted DNA-binding ribbon-helix-helix protein
MPKESSERRSRILTVHLEPKLHDAIKRIALKDGRTVSNLIRKLAEARVLHEHSTA